MATDQPASLAELWTRILASLELPSTRMLLSQQARLVRLDEQRAVVQVAGTWMAMVQTRQALVEQAINRALGGSRQLSLEAAGNPPPGPTSPPPQLPPLSREQAPSPAAAPPQPPPGPAPAASAPLAAPPAPAQPAVAQPGRQPDRQPDPPVAEQPRQPSSPLDANTRQFADFFNGEVVDIEEPIEGVSSADAA